MKIEITQVRFEGNGRAPEAIVEYRWSSRESSTSGRDSKATLVDWLSKTGNVAYVGSGIHQVNVGVVTPDRGAPYLRTHADGKYNNNLEHLPTFV